MIARRRDFITLLGGSVVAWPVAARAQQPAMPVIGVLYGVSASEWTRPIDGFHRGLAEIGFIEGRNVSIEYRWSEGQLDRMPAMAADLVGRKVSAILVGGALPAVRATMAATTTIPIVFTTQSDPVAAGIVSSLSRPGGNVTGVTGMGGELAPKRWELLQEVIPKTTRFALLVNPENPFTTQDAIQGAQIASQRLGLQIIEVNARNESEIDAAFSRAAEQRAGGLYSDDAYFESRREQIATLGLHYKMPTLVGTRDTVAAGALLCYAANVIEFYRKAGIYIGRILKGERPADLPVQQPTKFDLIINLTTAKAIGLSIPESFLLRADEVIE
jgi:putative tryptophan/tyrosine transport system substrate-binding protein